MRACGYMFTAADVDHPEDYRYTLFDVFRSAGFRSYHYSDQSRWGKYDSPINILTAHADSRFFLQEHFPGSFDDRLVEEFRRGPASVIVVAGAEDIGHAAVESFQHFRDGFPLFPTDQGVAVGRGDPLIVAVDQIAGEKHLLDAKRFEKVDDPRGHDFDDPVVAGTLHIGLHVGNHDHGPRVWMGEFRLFE